MKNKIVVPCDFSEEAIKNIKINFPEITKTECFDMSIGIPFSDNYTDIIIADLSLHYFTENKTFEILNDIQRVIKPKGLLIFRVNSINDTNHGAGKGNEIEKHLFETEDGSYKRFFEQEDLTKFFYNWEIVYAKEETMTRYSLPKQVWKCAVRSKK